MFDLEARLSIRLTLLVALVLPVSLSDRALAQPQSTVLVADEFVDANCASISGDGRWIAFECGTPSAICLYDRESGTYDEIAVGTCPSISTDGRYVVYSGSGTGGVQFRVYDRETELSEIVSLPAAGASGDDNVSPEERPGISADGRYVVFAAGSANLVPGDTNDSIDVFLRDRVAGTTELISVASDGTQGDDHSWDFDSGPTVSADGRYVAFVSRAENLVSDDGNGETDVFVRDRTAGTTMRVSLTSGGVEADSGGDWSVISDDGSVVAFSSDADNLELEFTFPATFNRHVYLRDVAGETTIMVSRNESNDPGNESSGNISPPSLSPDGRYVAFNSHADNLVGGVSGSLSNAYVVDRLTGSVALVSVDVGGGFFDRDASNPTISSDGRWVAFELANGALYLRDRGGVPGTTTTTLATTTTTLATTTTTTVSSGVCGDPVTDGSSVGDVAARLVTATDALFILQAAVGTQACEACVCDVNDSGTVTATDALVVLRFAVGQNVSLTCPPCT